eukprot:TRINITY_DN30483_c2_g2_i1.p1 TRINITY_DN30483_c2_g2~~TRINITY_DN30483_c2_g2_i1.p1  ORF type:complete len:492 (-),score=31.19 TRINITY_DN30483_c2_g2_i1:379-1731(-)
MSMAKLRSRGASNVGMQQRSNALLCLDDDDSSDELFGLRSSSRSRLKRQHQREKQNHSQVRELPRSLNAPQVSQYSKQGTAAVRSCAFVPPCLSRAEAVPMASDNSPQSKTAALTPVAWPSPRPGRSSARPSSLGKLQNRISVAQRDVKEGRSDLGIPANESNNERQSLQQLPELVAPVAYKGKAMCPRGVKLSSKAQQSLATFLNTVYGPAYRKSKHVDISKEDVASFAQAGNYGAETYGELTPEGFMDILWRVGAKPGDRFYDLGSGIGKLPAIAWMLGLRATGVELSRTRWDTACEAVSAMGKVNLRGELPRGGHSCTSGLPSRLTSGLDYVLGSFLDVDFRDADVVFISSVVYNDRLMSKVAEIARWMKRGAKIISFHNLADLGRCGTFPEFAELGECCEPTSWKDDTCFRVQQVVDSPSAENHEPLRLKCSDKFDVAHRCLFECV